MPKPQEICLVIAGGQRYNHWESVEVRRDTETTIDHAMLTVAEFTRGANVTDLQLMPGDRAKVYLAGQVVLDGSVYLRQAAYDANSHAVQIGISSDSQSIMVSTVDASPGQYKNQTIQQIGSAVFGKVGVKFNVIGGPSGADEKFARISEMVGETRFAFVERLCRLRNLHMLDDGQGGINAFRGPQGHAGQLVEGRNILRARLLLRQDEHVGPITGVGQMQNPGSGDEGRGAMAATANTQGPNSNRPFKFPVEDASTLTSLQHRVNHQLDWMTLQEVDGSITVPGWLDGGSMLWMASVSKLVTVNSPMLMPEKSKQFMIKGVIHRQNSTEGTTTDVLLTREDGLGTKGALQRGVAPDNAPDAGPTKSDIAE